VSSSSPSRRLRAKLDLTFERRRAERFSELVDESAGQRRRHRRTEYDAELVPLATLAASLGTARVAPSPGPEYRVGLRAMLMATIEREGIGACAINPEERPTDRPWQSPTRPLPVAARATAGTRRRTRVAVLVGVTTGALLLSGASMAGTNALPGDPFYALKIQAEKAQLAMAGNDLSRGYLYLGFAKARLNESRRLLLVGQPDRAAENLASMRDELQHGVKLLLEALVAGDAGDQNVIATIKNHRAGLVEELNRLSTDLPAGATSASQDALDQIGARLVQVEGWRHGTCTAERELDEFGPTFTCPAASSTKGN